MITALLSALVAGGVDPRSDRVRDLWRHLGLAGDVRQTAAFRRWFGRSQVVDGTGRPLVVYHGSGATIEAFDYRYTDQGADTLGSGFYFTTSRSEAEGYKVRRRDLATPKLGGEDAPSVVSAWLSIQRPLRAGQPGRLTPAQVRAIIARRPRGRDVSDGLDNWGDVRHEGRDRVMRRAVAAYAVEHDDLVRGLFPLANDFYAGHAQRFCEAVHGVLGYDGVVDDRFAGGRRHFVAFFPGQIKSTDNLGDFDPSDPRIRYGSWR